jgi:hypothetical protein
VLHPRGGCGAGPRVHRRWADGTLFPFLQPDALAAAAIGLLADTRRRTRLGKAARGWAERHLAFAAQHQAMDAMLAEAMALRGFR